MAHISQLPSEILIKIARCIRTYDCTERRAEILGTTNPGYLVEHEFRRSKRIAQNMRLEQATLLNFSSTCKAFKSLLSPEAHHFVSTITTQGATSPLRFMRLLDLLEKRPEICGWVKQAHLVLLPHPDGEVLREMNQNPITPPIWERIRQRIGAELQQDLLDSSEHGDCRGFDEKLYGVFLALILPFVRNLRGLSIVTTIGTVFRAAYYLRECPDLMAHSGPNGPSASGQQETILPSLLSLAINFPGYGGWSFGAPPHELWQCVAGLKASDQLSSVWVSGLYGAAPLQWTPESMCGNITSICLKNTYFSEEDLRSLVGRFRQLTAFKYFVADLDENDNEDFFRLSVCDILSILKSHAESLRTFCYGNELYPFDLDDHRPFEDLQMFNLEDLWIDIGASNWDIKDTPDLQEDILGNLPTSLKRLHIAGESDRILDSLQWLASNCKPDVMPQLNEVAFGPSSDHEGSDRERIITCIRSVFQEFQQNGVRVLHDVDINSFIR